MQIEQAISNAKRGFNKSGYDINGGECEDFMWAVVDAMGGFTDDLTDITTDRDSDLPGHYWIKYKGRFYDAECSKGVDDWIHLPIFRRHLKLKEVSIERGRP